MEPNIDCNPILAMARRIWAEANPVTPDDDAGRYLLGYAIELDAYPKCLRFHPELAYYEKIDGKPQHRHSFPALLACVQDRSGNGVNLHRTYLQHGLLAPVKEARKPLFALEGGAAVRLFSQRHTLALAVDVEAALAVHVMTGFAAWAALTPENLRRVVLPPDIGYVAIFAANDATYDEQAAAFALAARLKSTHSLGHCIEVDISKPPCSGMTHAQAWAWARRQGMRSASER